MKRTFITDTSGTLASALVSQETLSALNLGDRLVITWPLDLGYAGKIKAGETGTVDFIDPHTGLVEILLDVRHRGLDRWDNHMWLEPFGTEDIIGSVMLCTEAFRLIA